MFVKEYYSNQSIASTVNYKNKLNIGYTAGVAQAPPVRQLVTRVMSPEKLVSVKSLSATTKAIDTTAIISAYLTTCAPSSSIKNSVIMKCSPLDLKNKLRGFV